MRRHRLPARIGGCGLAGLAGLHAAWAAGSSWPFASRAELADAVVGTPDVPGPVACLAVSAALGTAAAFADGWPARHQALRRTGVAGAATVLAMRGGLGLAGRTDVIAPGSVSARFRRLDRTVYSPLCLLLAALISWPGPTGPG
jgi:hypothetical protein